MILKWMAPNWFHIMSRAWIQFYQPTYLHVIVHLITYSLLIILSGAKATQHVFRSTFLPLILDRKIKVLCEKVLREYTLIFVHCNTFSYFVGAKSISHSSNNRFSLHTEGLHYSMILYTCICTIYTYIYLYRYMYVNSLLTRFRS